MNEVIVTTEVVNCAHRWVVQTMVNGSPIRVYFDTEEEARTYADSVTTGETS